MSLIKINRSLSPLGCPNRIGQDAKWICLIACQMLSDGYYQSWQAICGPGAELQAALGFRGDKDRTAEYGPQGQFVRKIFDEDWFFSKFITNLQQDINPQTGLPPCADPIHWPGIDLSQVNRSIICYMEAAVDYFYYFPDPSNPDIIRSPITKVAAVDHSHRYVAVTDYPLYTTMHIEIN